MQRAIKKISTILIVFALTSCTIRQAKPMTLCEELTEGLSIEEIYETLTEEQLIECGYESGCWSTEIPTDPDEDYSYLNEEEGEE